MAQGTLSCSERDLGHTRRATKRRAKKKLWEHRESFFAGAANEDTSSQSEPDNPVNDSESATTAQEETTNFAEAGDEVRLCQTEPSNPVINPEPPAAAEKEATKTRQSKRKIKHDAEDDQMRLF
jgi:hypothetical protein